MIIACPACTTRYVVPDSAIGAEGRTVRCAKCRHSWFQEGQVPAEVDKPLAARSPADQPTGPVPAREPEVAEETQIAPIDASEASSSIGADAESAEDGPDAYSAQPANAEPRTETVPWGVDSWQAAESDDSRTSAPAPQPELADDSEPPIQESQGWGDVRASEPAWDSEEFAYSNFAHEPPFRPRRNRLKMWTWAASVFAIVALVAIAAVARYGLPDWMPLARQTFAEAQPDLVLDFPTNRQDRRTLPNGTEFFGASGTVTNVGKARRSVPTILIVLRDARERIVYSWEVAPAKRQLAPGESVSVNEAVTDVPKSAKFADIGWKPG